NSSMVRNPGAAGEESWHAKVTGARLDAGDCLQITVPSGGGYGDPLDRDPALVLSDVLDEFTTRDLAAQDYGVVLVGEGFGLAVDHAATDRLRAERRRA
ncbi:MAG: hydantoinase B/oxoprolinase family protein, partial [Actinomycetota bacterium]